MRKIAAIVLMVLGIIVLVAATAVLVRNRLSLPPWSVQTEGRWTAYGMHKWAFLVGELPLGLGLLLAGILLWPSRPSGLIAKGTASIALLIALAGLVAFAGLTYGLLRNVLASSPAPPTALELFSFLLAALAGLAPLLAMTVLAGGWPGSRYRPLEGKDEPAIIIVPLALHLPGLIVAILPGQPPLPATPAERIQMMLYFLPTSLAGSLYLFLLVCLGFFIYDVLKKARA